MKPNLGEVLADKYRLDRLLGEGGMSMVFAATNVLTGKQVAIKWLQPEIVRDEEQSQRLLREAQATSSIDHPNVVNVFDVGRHDGALFLVMEILHGEPLSVLLAEGSQNPSDFIALMMPVLRGVSAAHRAGVVHRDLKPDNIFCCRDPHGHEREAKVLDFGISKLAGDALESGRELTREGVVFGTPQYMAPEQMRDARIADVRSDIYALGVIFYRAFADQYPYDADTLTALAIRIVEGAAPSLEELRPELDVGLSDIIMRALALDPDHRYQSVAAFAHALEPYAGGVSFTPPERISSTNLRAQGVEREHDEPARDSAPPAQRASSPSVRSSHPLAAGRPSLALGVSRPSTRLVPHERAHSQPLRALSPLSVVEPGQVAQAASAPTPIPRARALRNAAESAHQLEHSRPLVRGELPAEDDARLSLLPAPPVPDAHSSLSATEDRPRNELEPVPSVELRPSRGLEVVLPDADVTLRLDGLQAPARRQTVWFGVALFAIGSFAPFGYRWLERVRGSHHGVGGAPSAASVATYDGQPIVHAPIATQAPIAPTAARDEQLVPAGLAAELQPTVAPLLSEKPKRRVNNVIAAPAAAPRVAAAPLAAPTQESGRDPVQPTPSSETERNPYLRR